MIRKRKPTEAIYVDGYLYGKTPLKYKTYTSAKRRVTNLKSQGFKAIIVYHSSVYQIWAV